MAPVGLKPAVAASQRQQTYERCIWGYEVINLLVVISLRQVTFNLLFLQLKVLAVN
jgi:hypothetical protein